MFRTFATSRDFDRRQITAGRPVYPFPNRNGSRRPSGVIPTHSEAKALVCSWRSSPVSGRPECFWRMEGIGAAPTGADPAPVPEVIASSRLRSQKFGATLARAILYRIVERLAKPLGGILWKSPFRSRAFDRATSARVSTPSSSLWGSRKPRWPV